MRRKSLFVGRSGHHRTRTSVKPATVELGVRGSLGVGRSVFPWDGSTPLTPEKSEGSMTEEEWQRCLELQQMADFLNERDWGSARKFRLFVSACVRRVWPLLTNERYRLAVEL